MAAHSPLRRWKRFFHVFDAIHGAIEAADPAVLAKDELGMAMVYQSAKAEVAEFLCDDPWNYEDYCRILDELMCEYLVTLKTVPVTPTALASTDLAKAVGVLLEHESEKIRGLARELIHQWRKSVERSEPAEARSSVEELVKLSEEALAPKKCTSVSVEGHAVSRVESAKRDEPAKISASLPKNTSAPVVASMAMMVKMEATKRKLREGYQEAADAKRQRKIVVIETPKMAEQRHQKLHPAIREGSQAKRVTSTTAVHKSDEKRQRKVHPIFRERNQARCASSTAVRRSLMPSFCRV